MIHSVEMGDSAALELSRLMSEPLMTNVTIGDIIIDNNGNIQYKANDNEWITVDISKPVMVVDDDSSSKYVDFEGLKIYDKKIKEYIEERLECLETKKSNNKYKVITGESD